MVQRLEHEPNVYVTGLTSSEPLVMSPQHTQSLAHLTRIFTGMEMSNKHELIIV